LLEINGISSANKRNDLVYHYLLDKENEIITLKSEIRLYNAELETLRQIYQQTINPPPGQGRPQAAGRNMPPPVPLQQPQQQLPHPPYNMGGGSVVARPLFPQSQQPQSMQQQPRYNNIPMHMQQPSKFQHQAAPPAASGAAPLGYYRGPGQRLPEHNSLQQMAKVEAKYIILNEVKRLKDSLFKLQDEKQQLAQQVSPISFFLYPVHD
jgi:hypothetical protein